MLNDVFFENNTHARGGDSHLQIPVPGKLRQEWRVQDQAGLQSEIL